MILVCSFENTRLDDRVTARVGLSVRKSDYVHLHAILNVLIAGVSWNGE